MKYLLWLWRELVVNGWAHAYTETDYKCGGAMHIHNFHTNVQQSLWKSFEDVHIWQQGLGFREQYERNHKYCSVWQHCHWLGGGLYQSLCSKLRANDFLKTDFSAWRKVLKIYLFLGKPKKKAPYFQTSLQYINFLAKVSP